MTIFHQMISSIITHHKQHGVHFYRIWYGKRPSYYIDTWPASDSNDIMVAFYDEEAVLYWKYPNEECQKMRYCDPNMLDNMVAKLTQCLRDRASFHPLPHVREKLAGRI